MAILGQTTDLSDALDHTYETREIKRGEIYYTDLKDIEDTNSHISGKI